jgi:fibronectin-binding autotransporter adhesin
MKKSARLRKLNPSFRVLLRATAVTASTTTLSLMLVSAANAQSLYWDADAIPSGDNTSSGTNLGGAGNWGSATNWYNGSAEVPWTAGSDAIFYGLAGTITLLAPQSANSLAFKTDGDVVSGSTLTMTPTAANFNVDSGVTATLGSVLAGTGTMTKLGSGTLVLSNAGNTNTAVSGMGGWLINAGTLRVSADGNFGVSPGSGVTDLQLNQSTIQAAGSFQEDITRRMKINTNSSSNLGDAIIDTHGFSVTWTGSIQGGPGSLLVTNTGGSPGIFILGTDKLNNINPWGSTLPAGTVNLTITGGAIVQTSGTATATGGEMGSETGADGAVLAIKLDNGQIRSESGGYSFQRNLILGPGGGSSDVGAWGQSFLGTISGAGALSKFGTATLVLDGSSSTWTGGTTISVGTLQIGRGGSTGFLPGDSANHYPVHIASGANLTIWNSSSPSIFADIDGQGTLTDSGPNRLRILGAWTYTGQTTVTSGSLTVQTRQGGGDTAGTIASNVQLNGATAGFDYNTSFPSTYGGTISAGPNGSVSVVAKLTGGTGKWTFTGANTYTGDTLISGPSSSANTLEIGNGGTTGSIVSPNVHSGGVLQFNRSNDLTYAGTITDYPSATYAATTAGSGALLKLGAGTLVLTGNSTYTNGTTLSAGALQLGNGGSSGFVAGNITNNASLVFNRSDNLTFGGVITGSGSLTKTGAGSVTLSGLSNSIGGSVNIANGTLVISGSASARNINQTAGALVLSGTGYLHIPAAGGATTSTSLVSSAPIIVASGRLDLDDNALIVNYGPTDNNATRDAIRNLLVNGRNAAPGNPAPWNGLGGIVSSYAHTNGNGSNLAIGYADNAQLAIVSASGSYTSFGGQTVGSSTILVQMTRGADANLDGNVDGQDVSIIGTHFNKPDSGQWYFGDFDYSGMCDGADVSVLGSSFGKTSPALSPAQLTAEFGSAFTAAFEAGASGASAVPEPTSAVILGLSSIALLRRRRQR